MPRTGRELVDGEIYHVINRGNGRNEVFKSVEDYEEFIELLIESLKRVDISLYSFCLMPNHFHILIKAEKATQMSEWMRWLMTSQVRRYHKRNNTSGHLWQGRYKCFPVQKNQYFEIVMRYIERNPLRAKLVRKIEKWKWSSLYIRLRKKKGILKTPPINCGKGWLEWVQSPITDEELVKLRISVNRCRPYGSDKWITKKAKEMGLESTLKKIGRPSKL